MLGADTPKLMLWAILMMLQIDIHSNWLPYQQQLQLRPVDQITGIVIHCTETPDLQTARALGEQIHYSQSATGNSGHYYIDIDGSIEQYVPIERIAHHVADRNHNSIGIELVNAGRYPDWLHSQSQQMTAVYPDAQLAALRQLLLMLRQQLPTLEWIAGHEDLDRRLVNASDDPHIKVHRKKDPGPMFPWSRVLDNMNLPRIDS